MKFAVLVLAALAVCALAEEGVPGTNIDFNKQDLPTLKTQAEKQTMELAMCTRAADQMRKTCTHYAKRSRNHKSEVKSLGESAESTAMMASQMAERDENGNSKFSGMSHPELVQWNQKLAASCSICMRSTAVIRRQCLKKAKKAKKAE